MLNLRERATELALATAAYLWNNVIEIMDDHSSYQLTPFNMNTMLRKRTSRSAKKIFHGNLKLCDALHVSLTNTNLIYQQLINKKSLRHAVITDTNVMTRLISSDLNSGLRDGHLHSWVVT
jgi:3-methyladenine DNA glycosylase Mpg